MDESTEAAQSGSEAFANLNRQAQRAGASIAAALAAGQVEGRKLDDVLRNVGTRLGDVALRTAGTSLARSLTTTLAQTLTSGISSVAGSAVSLAAPASLLGFGGAESGTAGSAASSTSAPQAARPLLVTMNISTPDAESFRSSEAQVSAALARAVQRGQRSL